MRQMSAAGARAAPLPRSGARPPLSSRQPGPLRLHSSSAPTAAAAAAAAQQQRRPPPGRRGLAAAAAGGGGRRQARAASGDLGDEFAELLERREELLRQQDEADEGLASEEDEELADITDRAWAARWGCGRGCGALRGCNCSPAWPLGKQPAAVCAATPCAVC